MDPSEGWRPTASSQLLAKRARLLQDIRVFFQQYEVMEVETPLLSRAGNSDPEIESVGAGEGAYLRTSPEFALKRLLAAGNRDIYELGRVFRSGETGRTHNPEFTLLEWYRTGFTYHELMDEVAVLVRHCGRGTLDDWPLEKLSYRELFSIHLDLDPFTADLETLAAAASKRGIADIELDHRQWLDLLMSLVIQPALPVRQLTFVFDYPADQAALARVRQDSPPVAERFELYLGSTELANGYQELTCAAEQRQRFEVENAQRRERGQAVYPVDEHLLAALEHGMPECAGVALGVDRLLMALTGVGCISEVIAFPASRA
ncbi:MAG: EF-P lysine aminoacylase EpmA [Xanthomonadales bacterium]|nr:EF-P lysine aminoacylase EpmA [Xanthomonadales bacterium]